MSKPIEPNARARDFLTNTLLAMVAFGVMVVVEKLVLMPFLGKRMSAAAFGELLLVRNTATVFASGIFAGLHNLLLRRNLEWTGAEKGLAVRSAACLGGVLGAVILLLLLLLMICVGQFEYLQKHLLSILAFGFWGITNIVYFLLQTYWRMQFRMKVFYCMQACNGIVLLLVVPLFGWLNEAGIYLGWLFAGVLPLVLTSLLAMRDSAFREGPFFSVALSRQMLRDMWVFVWGVVGQSLLQNVDRFVIGWLLGASAVASYFKVTNTAYMILVPVEPISGLLLSMAAQEQVGAQTKGHWWRLHGLIALILVGALIGGVVFGPPLTDMLYGAGTFASNPQLFWIILIGCLCAIVSVLLRGMLIVYVKAAWLVWHDTLTLVALLLLSAILTYRHGLTGAAMAVAISLALRACLSELAVAVTLYRQSS